MKDLKAIAIYLPQYHRVKENDEWWGEGYTEWTAVRKAEKLYEGHEQPRVPLDNRYYDLMQKDTMKWQANLAREYNIYGFCFFHYYFKDGRKILEKPAENLLQWSDIDINYCFSWANEPWARTWSKISGGSMASKFEKYEKGEEDGVLLQQAYGGEAEWEEHFRYLLTFFKDDRYIKVNGKPLFLFHVPEKIDCLGEMVKCWRALANSYNLPGLYLVGVITNSYREFPMLDAIYAHEPRLTFHDYIKYSDDSKKDVCGRYNIYEDVYTWSSTRMYFQKQKLYFGAFVGFDSTPRHGKRGAIIDKVTPAKFEEYFRKICQRSMKNNNGFVFINAWNEWGESNYLEPDAKNKYSYLNAVKTVLEESKDEEDLNVSTNTENDITFQIIKECEVQRDKFKSYYAIVNQWLALLENRGNLAKYFERHSYVSLAIYGFGSLGKHLFYQLHRGINVKYIIDRKINIDDFCLPIYRPDEELPKVDVIVVTVVNEFDEICNVLREKYSGDIVSLKNVIQECL